MSTQSDWPPDEDRAKSLEVYMWVGCGLATVTVFARLYARLFICRTPGWDDFFIGTAYVFAISLYATTQALIHNGFGQHRVYLTDEQVMAVQKLDLPVYVSAVLVLALARISIGVFLLRLVYPLKRMAIPIYIGLGINAIQAIGFLIWNFAHCVPTSKIWDPTVEGSCVDTKTYTAVIKVLGGLNVAVDLIFALFPLVLLWRSQVTRNWRLMIILLLSCGLLASVCGIARIVTFDIPNPDITWLLVPHFWWSISESTAVLILSCVPAFYQLFNQFSNKNDSNSLVARLIPSTMQVRTRQGRTSHESHERAKELGLMEPGVEVRRDVFVERCSYSPQEEQTGISFEDQLAKALTVQNVSRAWGQDSK